MRQAGRRRQTLTKLLVLSTVACGERSSSTRGSPASEDIVQAEGNLVHELTIGGVSDEDPRYQFSAVASVLEGPDGVVWVADGARGSPSPLLRQFDAEGVFIRQVGRAGPGPGEYSSPQGLALLKDGRVALRDAGAPGRITVFRRDGTLDAIWSLGARFRWSEGAGGSIQVDTSGVVWLPVRGNVRPGPGSPPPFFLRVLPSGQVLDSVPIPPLPTVERVSLMDTTTTRSGGLRVRGVSVPLQPAGVWAWSPWGTFAVARTDVYEVRHATAEGRVFSREVRPVAIASDHLDALEERIRTELDRLESGRRLQVPKLPVNKPIIRDVRFADDGTLMVLASLPSIHRNGVWVEPPAFDFFRPEGDFLGRLGIDEGLRLSEQTFRVSGTRVWAVHRDRLDVESVRRYHIHWRGDGGPR